MRSPLVLRSSLSQNKTMLPCLKVCQGSFLKATFLDSSFKKTRPIGIVCQTRANLIAIEWPC